MIPIRYTVKAPAPITRVFLGFLLFSLILPMALMEGLWIRAMLDVHESRLQELLETGKQLAISELDSDLEKLELTATHQAAALYTKGRPLTQNLCKERLGRHIPPGLQVMVQDPHGLRCQVGSSSIPDWRLLSLPHREMQTLLTLHHQPYLLVRLRLQNHTYLTVAQPLTVDTLFHTLQQVIPQVQLRWLPMSPDAVSLQHHRRVHALRQNGLQGYLLVSLPQAEEDALIRGGWVATITSILFGLLSIGGIGWWLGRSLILPMQSVVHMASEVTSGRLTYRMPPAHSLPEVNTMISRLNRMLDHLQEDAALQQGFIASLTHDLRTPLLAEQRVIELILESDTLPVEYQRLADQLAQNNQHLLVMVNLLLETYQFESSREAIQPSRFLLAPVIAACFDQVSVLADEKRITLSYELTPSDMVLHADPILIRRVLLNLLGNAIANIPVGGHIRVNARHEAENHYMLTIEDNGPGIPAVDLPHMFQRYHASRRQKIGSGLGLSICRKIVEAHGGQIQVHCPPEGGTCFTITLPDNPVLLPVPV